MWVALKKFQWMRVSTPWVSPLQTEKMELHTKLVVPSESTPEEDSFESYHHSI